MEPWLLLILSPFAGSFLGVLADRLPEGRDVLAARSRCAACGHVLGPADLVPILSWAWRRGRCGHCGAAIPLHLPLIEAGTMAGAALALALDPPGGALAGALVLWLLATLALADARHRRLPDVLTAALAVVALATALAAGHGGAALAGAAIGAGGFWLIRIAYRALRGREGLGMGDVKLMAGIGALHPLADLPLVVALGAGLGLAWALAAHRGRPPAALALPFGSFLCAGSALVLVAGWLAPAL